MWAGDGVSVAQRELVETLFQGVGIARWVGDEEDLLDAVTV